MNQENTSLKNKINEIQKENYEENILLKNQINAIKKENLEENILLKKHINETKEEMISGDALLKNEINETKKEMFRDNTLLKKQINETKEEMSKGNALLNNEINEAKEDMISGNALLKNQINGVRQEFLDENTLLKSHINEIKEENKELKKHSHKAIKIQSGEYYADFFDLDEYHYMYEGTDYRSYKYYITFNEKYENVPNVMVSISQLDTDSETNLRIDVSAENIDTSGFYCTIMTWHNTKIYRVKVSWISFG